MTKYYVNVPDEIARQLESVADDDIIEVLTKLAEKESSSDELAAYDSVSAIRGDDTLSESERKRRIIRAKRKGLPR